MSWRCSAYVKGLKICPNGEPITKQEKYLLLIMADYYNDKVRGAWASASQLADDGLMDKSSVWRLIRKVEKKGVIVKEKRDTERGDPDSNMYRFPGVEEMYFKDKSDEGGSGKMQLPPKKKAAAGSVGGSGKMQPRSGVMTPLGSGKMQPRSGNMMQLGSGADATTVVAKSEGHIRNEQIHEHESLAHTIKADVSECVSGVPNEGQSKFTLEECRSFAYHLKNTGQGITNPGGYATTIYRSGEADPLIEKFLEPGATAPNTSQCPDCGGMGFYYVNGIDQGGPVTKCNHPNLGAS